MGVNWNVATDQIIFSLELAEQARRLEPTKQNDPLGFLAPIVISYKVFMQTHDWYFTRAIYSPVA